MERLKQLFGTLKTSYEPLDEDAVGFEGQALMNGGVDDEDHSLTAEDEVITHTEAPFSWAHYAVFTLLGVAMLWAWYVPSHEHSGVHKLTQCRNMFLAAGPYFQSRFKGEKWILANFQSAELSVSTVVNLGAMLVLTNLQANASYPRRIIMALVFNIGTFSLLAISTRIFLDVSAVTYFVFIIVQVLTSSLATGLMQNGIFAYMSSFGREEYAQGCMTGQAIAGVLPCIVQIVSVLSVPPVDATKDTVKESSGSALAFFATASAVSFITLLAFIHLLGMNRKNAAYKATTQQDRPETPRKPVPLLIIYRKTFFLSTSVFITFVIAMFYPVYTQQIQSVHTPADIPRVLEPASFIPLAMLIWNVGDLVGRLLSAIPSLSITNRPHLLLTLAVGRVLLIPLYLLCNIKGRGATINSDVFYFLLQIVYGVTNGFIGTMCMMGAVEYVDVIEREATGAFMTLMLVGGLTAGSLLSFVAT
jgi:equilibrative nucleoside transporter 1/2/3